MNFYKKFKIKLKYILKKPISIDELLFSHIRNDFNIIEAGAHNGNDTKRLAKLTNNTVYAFEPIPELYQELIYNTKTFNNVSTFNIALADQDGELTMFKSSGASNASSSLLEPNKHLEKNPEVKFTENIQIKALTLDEWARNNSVNKIDFMWLDMQGFEYKMLKASKEIFPTLKVLYTEISTIELYKGQGVYPEYKSWLLGSGFKLIKEELPWGFTGNALFVRK